MTILLGLFFIASIINVANAQQKTPEQRAQYLTAEMTKLLALSKEQSAKVNTINLNSAEQIDAVRKNPNLGPEDKQDQINDIQQDRDQKFQEVLTAEQFKKYQELKPQWIQKNREQRKLIQQNAVGQENR